jgi:hypothetical protein
MLGARVPTTDPEKPLILKFSDYKQFGKVRQPAKIIEEAGTERTTITYTQIDVDTNFRMSLDPPDEVKNLK